MAKLKEQVYLCQNEQEWLYILQQLNKDKRSRWLHGEPPLVNGIPPLSYQKGYRDVIFYDSAQRLSHADIEYAENIQKKDPKTKYIIQWVKDLI